MTSEVEICNLALDRIGGSEIQSLEDNTPEARLCQRVYPRIRDRMLQVHPWKFATKRVKLVKTSNTPAHTFTTEFQLPTDYLKMILFNDFFVGRFIFFSGSATDNFFGADLLFKREGDKILTNDDVANLIYVFRETSTGNFDDTFVEVLADRLAWRMAYPLTQSRTLTKDLRDEYNQNMQEATAVNSQEDIEEVFENSTYLDARF